MLQQHDGLGIADPAVADHCHRRLEAEFDHVDVFALCGNAAAAAGKPVRRAVATEKEEQPLRHRAGTHEDVPKPLDLMQPETRLLFQLGPDPVFRGGLVEEPRRRLDQPIVAAVDESGKAELADQHDAPRHRIVGQDHRTVAAIVGLPRQTLPVSVATAKFQLGPFQDAPVVGKEGDVAEPDTIRNVHPLVLTICCILQIFAYFRAESSDVIE